MRRWKSWRKPACAFRPQKALTIFAEHGAQVDWRRKLSGYRVTCIQALLRCLAIFYWSQGISFDLQLQDGTTYFTTMDVA